MASPPLFSPPTATELAENQGSGIVAANLVVAILATISVGLRFLSRRVQKTVFGIDDWLILAALPFGWGMCACTLIAVQNGLGKHFNVLLATQPNVLLKEGQAYFASEIIWTFSIPLIKISILMLYIRIFGRLRYFRIIALCLGTFTICWFITVVLVITFQCNPVMFAWDKSIDGTCINAWLFFVIGSTLNTITDFAILILPLPAVWHLTLGKFQRISLIGIFMLGSLTCVISLVRLVTVIQDQNNMDVTWATGIVAVWSTAEPCLGIVAACLPTLRPLFSRFIPTTSSSSARGGYSSNESGGSSSTGQSQRMKKGQPRPAKDSYTDSRTETYIMSGPEVDKMSGDRSKSLPHNAIEVSTSWQSRSTPSGGQNRDT